jgi:hypothetical protein
MVSQGEAVSAGYGAAWFDYWRGAAVCYPVPVHWLVRWARELYFRWHMARHAWTSRRRELAATETARRERELLAEQYASGYAAGWAKCHDDVAELVRRELEAAQMRRRERHRLN